MTRVSLAQTRRLLLGGAVIAALWVVPILADPLDGTVNVSVTNASQGGASPSGDQAYLLVFGVKEQQEVDTKTGLVDATGHVTFTDLDRDANLAYFAVVEHQGATYSFPQPFQLNNTQTQNADVHVYDGTTDDNALKLDQVNLLVTSASNGMLHMMEMGTLDNGSDHTFVTEDPQDQQLAHAVKFALPPGAMNASMQTGFSDSSVIPALGGIQVTSPVQPGPHPFALSFDIPYTSNSVDLSVQVPYQAGTVQLYVPSESFTLHANQLALTDHPTMNGQTYDLYAASNVPANTMISSSLDGLPTLGGRTLTPNQLALMSLGAVLLVLGGGTLFLTLRPRRKLTPTPVTDGISPESPSGDGNAREELHAERTRLVLALAELDERYTRHAVAPSAYEEERARGKQRLLELTHALRGA